MTGADVTVQDYRLIPPDSVTPHPDNPRRGHLAAITDSIRTNGFYGAIVVQQSTSRVIAGNHRLLAARELGLAQIPATFVDVDDQTALRILAVDNRANDLAGYDNDALLELLTTLDATEMRLEGTGYTDADLDQLLNPQGPPALTDADDVPAAPAQPVTRVGDVWLLGPHRLLCGDATEAAAYTTLLNGSQADLVFTDPPYGIDYRSNTLGPDSWQRKLANDIDTTIATPACDLLPPNLTPAAAVYLTTRWDVAPYWMAALQAAGLRIKNQIVWLKSLQGMGDLQGAYGSRWEAVLFAHDGNHKLREGRPDDVWDIGHIFTRGHRWHETEKPVALPIKAITNSSDPDGLVLDPFAGSGSTLIACHATGRVARLMEIDPAYCDVILQRFTDHTGITPTNQDTGQAWAGKRHTSETVAV